AAAPAAGGRLADAHARGCACRRGRNRQGRDDQGAERRPRRRTQGGGNPRRGRRTRRPRDRRQRRRGAVARRRLGRGGPARAPGRDPAPARARLSLVGAKLPCGAQGPVITGPALPAASRAWNDQEVAGAPGKTNVPAGSLAVTGWPLIVPLTVAGSLSWKVNAAPFTTLSVGATVSIANGTSRETVASGSVAVTTAVYWPSGSRTPAA